MTSGGRSGLTCWDITSEFTQMIIAVDESITIGLVNL